MTEPTVEMYEHNGTEFQITTTVNGGRYQVVVTLDGLQVSPVYGVDISTHHDYFAQHEESLVAHLRKIAKSDISEGMYYKP